MEHKIGYEITNTGADIHQLQLSHVFLDEAGEKLAVVQPFVVREATISVRRDPSPHPCS